MSRSHARGSFGRGDRTPDTPRKQTWIHSSAARSESAPLEETVRTQMESSLGADFSAVRIHADSAAAESARAIGAAAYTVGQDIVFGAGRYQPHSDAGLQLLGHELAHVVQQSRGGMAPSDAETRADRAADQARQGSPVSAEAFGGAPVGVQAKPDDGPGEGLSLPTKTLSRFVLNSAALTSA